MDKKKRLLVLHLLAVVALVACGSAAKQQSAQSNARPEVIAYWFGDTSTVHEHNIGELTQIIYSFLVLDGDRLDLNDEKRVDLERLVTLKQDFPHLKVLIALGGWGGCETCSSVFARADGRAAFAASAKAVIDELGLDGIDLDWEYPAIEGYPGHEYRAEDKQNFTALVRELREQLGGDRIISFAAGASDDFVAQSVEWLPVMAMVDHVNLMTYDFVNGFSRTTGHHTPLCSTGWQEVSLDRSVRLLQEQGVEARQIVIGAAFYARVWDQVEGGNTDHLAWQASFRDFVGYREFDQYFGDGFEFRFDDAAGAAWGFDAEAGLFASFDDRRSAALKARYTLQYGLGGIMFWQLGEDVPAGGLLDAIAAAIDGGSTGAACAAQ